MMSFVLVLATIFALLVGYMISVIIDYLKGK